jgi:fatty acid desaturase
MPAWMCFILNAFCTSFLHELEHDLIHQLYFRTKPIVQNVFMGLIWLFRGNLISPWYRKLIHLLHHRESGQTEDIEERLIGNGEKWGFKRLLLTLDPGMSLLQFATFKKQLPQLFSIKQILFATFPIFILFNIIWFSFLTHQGWRIINLIHEVIPPFPVWYINLVNILMVVYIGPNILRQMSLSLISPSCHYYGDVTKGNILQQTQVLQPWYLIPFQLFCFNFGSTHIIHHFVVNQPFYVRQMVAPLAHAAMRKYGIRFNDIQTFFRANRYSLNAI